VGGFAGAGGARGCCSHDQRRLQRDVWVNLPETTVPCLTIRIYQMPSRLPRGRGPPDGLHGVTDVGLIHQLCARSLYNSAHKVHIQASTPPVLQRLARVARLRREPERVGFDSTGPLAGGGPMNRLYTKFQSSFQSLSNRQRSAHARIS
jgi:hypothetical protein